FSGATTRVLITPHGGAVLRRLNSRRYSSARSRATPRRWRKSGSSIKSSTVRNRSFHSPKLSPVKGPPSVQPPRPPRAALKDCKARLRSPREGSPVGRPSFDCPTSLSFDATPSEPFCPGWPDLRSDGFASLLAAEESPPAGLP